MMDVLTHGSLEEKAAISFKIVDIDGDQKISYKDFQTAVLSILEMWYTMTGSQVRLSESTLQYLFNKIDCNNTGEVLMDDYISILSQKTDMFNWFDILNNGYSSGIERPSQRDQAKVLEKQKEEITVKTKEKLKEISGAHEQIQEVLDLIQSIQPDEMQIITPKLGGSVSSTEKTPSPKTNSESPLKGKVLKIQRRDTFGQQNTDSSSKREYSPMESPKKSHSPKKVPIDKPCENESLKFEESPIQSPTEETKRDVFDDLLAQFEASVPKKSGYNRPIKKDMIFASSSSPLAVVEENNNEEQMQSPFDETIVKDNSSSGKSGSKKSSSLTLEQFKDENKFRFLPIGNTTKSGQKHEVTKGDSTPGIITPDSSSESSSENQQDNDELLKIQKDINSLVAPIKLEKLDTGNSPPAAGASFLSTTLTETRKNELVEKLKKIKNLLNSALKADEYFLNRIKFVKGKLKKFNQKKSQKK